MELHPVDSQSSGGSTNSDSSYSPVRGDGHTLETSSIPSVSENGCTQEISLKLSASGLSLWARSLSLKIPLQLSQEDLQSGSSLTSPLERITSRLGLLMLNNSHMQDANGEDNSIFTQPGILGSLTRGLMDSSMSAMKAVQVKARHIASQNKRRYQDGGFDLDMTYITDNIIAMGFPAGNMSSGFLGYFEGFYRNHMEEVIEFFETRHKGRYKVYNLCSERLYDASLFKGKVACFPFDDHNCPPLQLIKSFCESAYAWLKGNIENVVVVHCKAGMARTGLMVSSLLLFLKFFPTSEECIEYYNQRRCIDGKGLILPSQIRYVKYFERIQSYLHGGIPAARRCMLRGFRLHECPYWIRPSITISDHNGILFSTRKHPKTTDLMPEDFWFSSKFKEVKVFALPGEPGLAQVAGDFKIHFLDRQGDFYCWLNTSMMENRITLGTADLDDFDKRKIPSPSFEVEIILADYDRLQMQQHISVHKQSQPSSVNPAPSSKIRNSRRAYSDPNFSRNHEKDDVFSDSESEGSWSSKIKQIRITANSEVIGELDHEAMKIEHDQREFSLINDIQTTTNYPINGYEINNIDDSTLASPCFNSSSMAEFKAIAADTSIFSFGDEDYESD